KGPLLLGQGSFAVPSLRSGRFRMTKNSIVNRRRLTDLLVVVAVAVIYIGCAKLGLALAFRAAQVTAVWPPTGFAIAAVLRLGRRSVPGILIGALIANATTNEPLSVATGIAIGNTLEAVVGAMLLRRLGFDGRLAR